MRRAQRGRSILCSAQCGWNYRSSMCRLFDPTSSGWCGRMCSRLAVCDGCSFLCVTDVLCWCEDSESAIELGILESHRSLNPIAFWCENSESAQPKHRAHVNQVLQRSGVKIRPINTYSALVQNSESTRSISASCSLTCVGLYSSLAATGRENARNHSAQCTRQSHVNQVLQNC